MVQSQWSILTSQATHEHCQVLCDIYDDYPQVKTMLKDATTVDKAVDLITELSGKIDAQSNN